MAGLHSHDDDFLYEIQRPPNEPSPRRRSKVERAAQVLPISPRLLRISDAAKYLSCTNWYMETLLREGIVRSFFLGKRKVVDVRDLDAYIDRLKSDDS